MTQTITLAFLGCGNMGLAILNGLLSSLPPSPSSSSSSSIPSKETNPLSPPTPKPTKFILSVRSSTSTSRLSAQFAHDTRITVLQAQNVQAAHDADAVLLGCKPHMVSDLLRETGLRDALAGKLLISVVAGWTRSALETALYGSPTTKANADERCWVARAIPNVAAAVGASATGVEVSDPVLPERYSGLVDAVFVSIGTVAHLAPAQMDVSTAFGSTPAFFAIICDALIDGAVAMGMPRAQAQEMTFQCLKGSAELMLAGDSPSALKEKVTSPGGSTIGAIMGMEEAGVRGIMSRALRESASIASLLGQGYANVNGTRGMTKL